MKHKVYIMQLDMEGIADTVLDTVKFGEIPSYMMQRGFTRLKNSAIFYKKGRKVLYGKYAEKEIEHHKPFLEDYQKCLVK